MARKTAHAVAEELLLDKAECETLARTTNALRSRNVLLRQPLELHDDDSAYPVGEFVEFDEDLDVL